MNKKHHIYVCQLSDVVQLLCAMLQFLTCFIAFTLQLPAAVDRPLRVTHPTSGRSQCNTTFLDNQKTVSV